MSSMLNIQDPIRNALRQLVSEKRIWAWDAIKLHHHGTTQWIVVLMHESGEYKPGRCPPPYTADEVNDLIGMLWTTS